MINIPCYADFSELYNDSSVEVSMANPLFTIDLIVRKNLKQLICMGGNILPAEHRRNESFVNRYFLGFVCCNMHHSAQFNQ
jgi:hypothetical protein